MIIGDVKLQNNVFLAPMAGVTDMPFRILCKEQGCGLVYTEMVSAKGMQFNDKKTGKIANINDIEKPVALQIFGSDPLVMAQTVEKLNSSDARIIDINMGCPAPKITKNGEGSALMNNPVLARKIIKEVVKASTKPVTVKIRKGWDDTCINAIEFACMIEDSGASAITIHGRTREQFYSGVADWDIIRQVKLAVKIPVIGNGDVVDGDSAKELLTTTGCDAVMIGRGAQGNPWIFNEVTSFLNDETRVAKPSNREKIDMIIRHMDMLIAQKGEYTGLTEMRKHIAWYIKGMRNCTYFKNIVFKLVNKDDIISQLEKFLSEQTIENN